jgi:hypothetical protein
VNAVIIAMHKPQKQKVIGIIKRGRFIAVVSLFLIVCNDEAEYHSSATVAPADTFAAKH